MFICVRPCQWGSLSWQHNTLENCSRKWFEMGKWDNIYLFMLRPIREGQTPWWSRLRRRAVWCCTSPTIREKVWMNFEMPCRFWDTQSNGSARPPPSPQSSAQEKEVCTVLQRAPSTLLFVYLLNKPFTLEQFKIYRKAIKIVQRVPICAIPCFPVNILQ